MYLGSDGKVYQNKFESLGHGTKLPGYADEQRQVNDRLHELRQRQQEYAGKEQQQEQAQQQMDRGDTDNFYNRQRQLAEVQGQPYGGYGQGNPKGAGQAGQQQRSGQAGGFGMPMERKETVQDPLVEDAGKLHKMLNEQYRQQRGMADPSSGNPQDLINAQANRRGATDGGSIEDITGFINQHPSISHNNVSAIRFNDSDRNDDPLVSFLGEGGDPVKQFYLSALSNLNNFAGQKQQKYNPGRQVKEPEQQMQQLQAMAQQLAAQELAGESESVRNKNMPAEIQHQYQQLMKQYGPVNPGYEDTGFSQPNQTPGFNVFDNRQQGQEGDYLAYLQKMLGGGGQEQAAPPPPSGTPANATPKQGSKGFGFGNNNAPGTWRNFNPYGR